jgi:hypothetical protein
LNPSFLYPCLAPYTVIPAKAGIQYSVRWFNAGRMVSPQHQDTKYWAPVFAGVTPVGGRVAGAESPDPGEPTGPP